MIRIGCSGFNYRHWKGLFYPTGLAQKKWFVHYCTVFNTVELNVTFYRLPFATTFDKWRDETPEDFAFSLKGSRFITHVRRLRDPEQPLERFFEGALRLGEKLQVVLWQFPPAFGIDLERLRKFLGLLDGYQVRNTLEFRNETWMNEEVVSLCREHHVALCSADWPEFLRDAPAAGDFVYVRRHGRGGHYDSRYSAEELKEDARMIRARLKEGKDVFIYFNNDAHAYAPQNAQVLMELTRPG